MNRVHNWMFSECSRESMSRILSDGWHTRCLLARRAAYCGNALVERGEQCDCGTAVSCDVHDRCCTPASLKPDRPSGRACRLR